MKKIALPILAALTMSSLCGAVALAQTTGRQDGARASIRLAQSYDPGLGSDVQEVYVDEYGRRVFIDGSGRIVGVEQPRRERFRQRRRRFEEQRGGGAVVNGPPPPGVTVEGRVDVPDGGFYDPGYPEPPQSADPYRVDPGPDDTYASRPRDERPVAAEPLPAPTSPGRDTPSIPDSAVANYPNGAADDELPAPGSSIVKPDGQSVGERNPAPSIRLSNGKNSKAEVAALQVILDRAGMSPGVIDGRMGSNVDKAVAAYNEKFGHTLPTGDPQALAEELDRSGGPAIVSYEITAEDAAGPYVASIPSDYAVKATLPELSFERPSEKLAERFHMDEDYLKEINPGADFARQGVRIKVASVGANVQGEVSRIIADKGREQVRAYAADGSLLAAYPSTIGSSDTPSPSGTVQVNRIAFNPNYTYNPKINFKQAGNDKVLTIPPGPNGPVGSIWIALSKPTYGIHGTPEPSKIGKTNSHGCVRLTNWDAKELAKIVKPGVTVEFTE